MKRTRLLWLLFGTTATSIAATVSWFLANRSSERIAIMLITEPAADFRDISAGEMLIECGFSAFTISGIIPDGRQIISFPLDEDNSRSFACVSEHIQKGHLEWTLTFDEPRRAALKTSGFSS